MRADELDADTALHGGTPRLGPVRRDLLIVAALALVSIGIAAVVFRAVAHAVVWAGADPTTRGPVVVLTILGLALVLAAVIAAADIVNTLRDRRRRRRHATS